MMQENTWRFFFRKVLLAYRSLQNVFAGLFIYSNENCIIWHLLASISAFLEFVSSSVPAVLEYRHFQTRIT